MSTYLPTVFGENLLDVLDDFDRNFDRNFFHDFGNIDHALYGKHAQHMMKTDVRETENAYEVNIDLPGFNKDEIHLELNHGYLTIATEKTLEKEQAGNNDRILRRERYSGSMQRSFYVGEHITEEDVKASYENGVLHLRLPRKEAQRVPERKTIMIEG